MFTGIIEASGTVLDLKSNADNLEMVLSAPFGDELKIDQSVAHNGACLTVVKISGKSYTVVAINETLLKTNLGLLKIGDVVNLERSMKLNDRLDGHLVQGHIDQIGVCTKITDAHGSWIFSFEFDNNVHNTTIVDKGSICVNGVSLTVAKTKGATFEVAIIPYTFENTNFCKLKVNDVVNLEFDIIGKYIAKNAAFYLKNQGL
jgi:riboflavin synthase